MGNLLSFAKEWKSFLQEIPRILAAFVEALFGVTQMLQDLEEIFVELKELSDLLELLKATCKENERHILHQRATGLMKSTKNKLYHAAQQSTHCSGVLKNVEAMISTLIDATETYESIEHR